MKRKRENKKKTQSLRGPGLRHFLFENLVFGVFGCFWLFLAVFGVCCGCLVHLVSVLSRFGVFGVFLVDLGFLWSAARAF